MTIRLTEQVPQQQYSLMKGGIQNWIKYTELLTLSFWVGHCNKSVEVVLGHIYHLQALHLQNKQAIKQLQTHIFYIFFSNKLFQQTSEHKCL